MKISRIILTTTMAAALTACGGGSGGGSGTPATSTSSTVSGVAATGRAMSSGSVVVGLDSAGHTANTTVGSNGAFELNVASLSYPILIKATEGGVTLFSAIVSNAEASGKININQLTHLGVVGVLGNDTPVNIENYFKTPGNSDKVTAGTLSAAQLNAVAFLSDSVFDTSGLNRAQIGDVRTDAGFKIGQREDKLLDQLTPSTSAGKAVFVNLTSIPSLAVPTRVTSYATQFSVLFGSNVAWCNGTTDTTVYTTPDVVVYGVSATDQDKLDAARAAQISINEIKTQMGYTAPGSGIGFDGATKLSVCVDGSGRQSSGEANAHALGVTAMSKDIAGGLNERKWRHLVKHELFHSFQGVLVGQTDPWNVLDRWFQEGTAEFISGSDYLDTSAKVTAWQSAYEKAGTCTPAKVNSYTYMTTNCQYGSEKEGDVLYRAYTTPITMLFDAASYGGGGNSLTKISQLMTTIKNGATFQAAFDAQLLTLPGVVNPITLADLKTSSWATWASSYTDKTVANVTLSGVPNGVKFMLLANPNSTRKNDNIWLGDSADGSTAMVSLRYVAGPVVFRAMSTTNTMYQSPTTATVTWATDVNGKKTPTITPSSLSYSSGWSVLP